MMPSGTYVFVAAGTVRPAADLKTVKDRMGHSQIQTTQVYLHALPEADDRALAAFQRTRGRSPTLTSSCGVVWGRVRTGRVQRGGDRGIDLRLRDHADPLGHQEPPDSPRVRTTTDVTPGDIGSRRGSARTDPSVSALAPADRSCSGRGARTAILSGPRSPQGRRRGVRSIRTGCLLT
jgi:hypothetical protein